MEQIQIQIQIHLYNCAKINNANNSPYITFDSTASILKPTKNTICRESCFTIASLLMPSLLKQQLQNTSGVFTIRENITFLKNCEINNNTNLETGFIEFLSLYQDKTLNQLKH
jgi:hypothetical protein